MSEQAILDAFAGHAFLRNLSGQHLMILASGARPFTAAPGEYLGREGETANHFYLIQSGHVSIEMPGPDREAARVQTVGLGEAVGWSWLVPPHRWQFDCRAIDTVQGLALDAEWLREKCEQDHSLSHHLLKRLVAVLAGRLAATRFLLSDLSKSGNGDLEGVSTMNA
jgi:CRP/FNR family cyclic AMP-dependent transcriptional regulator